MIGSSHHNDDATTSFQKTPDEVAKHKSSIASQSNNEILKKFNAIITDLENLFSKPVDKNTPINLPLGYLQLSELGKNKLLEYCALHNKTMVMKYMLALKDETKKYHIDLSANNYATVKSIVRNKPTNHVLSLLFSAKDDKGKLRIDPRIDNNFAIRFAALHGNYAFMKWLLTIKTPSENLFINPRVNSVEIINRVIQDNNYEMLEFVLKLRDNKGDPLVDLTADDNAILCYAAETGNCKMINMLLGFKDGSGHPIIDPASNCNEVLVKAIKNGHCQAVRLFLRLKDSQGKNIIEIDEEATIDYLISEVNDEIYPENHYIYGLLLAYASKDDREAYKQGLSEWDYTNCELDHNFFDNIQAAAENKELQNVYFGHIFQFLYWVYEKDDYKKIDNEDINKLVKVHQKYDLSLSVRDLDPRSTPNELNSYRKSQKHLDIANLRLVCKDFYDFIKKSTIQQSCEIGFLRLGVDISNFILSFIVDDKYLKIERRIYKLELRLNETHNIDQKIDEVLSQEVYSKD